MQVISNRSSLSLKFLALAQAIILPYLAQYAGRWCLSGKIILSSGLGNGVKTVDKAVPLFFKKWLAFIGQSDLILANQYKRYYMKVLWSDVCLRGLPTHHGAHTDVCDNDDTLWTIHDQIGSLAFTPNEPNYERFFVQWNINIKARLLITEILADEFCFPPVQPRHHKQQSLKYLILIFLINYLLTQIFFVIKCEFNITHVFLVGNNLRALFRINRQPYFDIYKFPCKQSNHLYDTILFCTHSMMQIFYFWN